MKLSDAARSALGADLRRSVSLTGGDLSRVFLVTLENGCEIVAKQTPRARAEAEMLRAIQATGCPAPDVIHCDEDLILMERLASDGPAPERHWAGAGAAVAKLHASSGPSFGWKEDHGFGPVAIPGGTTETWPTFWASRRLLAWPAHLPKDILIRVERLADGLSGKLPETPPASLLHGDLWTGNLIFGRKGFSGLIDPACSYGDAEVDLAMLELFGTPPPAFYESYGGHRQGWQKRRPIYQLWPALVHLRLFGASYRSLVTRLLSEAGV